MSTNKDLDNVLSSLTQYRNALVANLQQKGSEISSDATLYQGLHVVESIQNLQPQAEQCLAMVLQILGIHGASDSQSISISTSISSSSQEQPEFDLRPYANTICKTQRTMTPPQSISDIGYIQITSVNASYESDYGYGQCYISKSRYNYSSLVAERTQISAEFYSTTYQTGMDYSSWDGVTIPQVDPDSIPIGEPYQYSDYSLSIQGSFRTATAFYNDSQAEACAAGNPLRYAFIVTVAYPHWTGWFKPKITWTDGGSTLTAVLDLSSLNTAFDTGDTQIKDNGGSKSYSHTWVTLHFNPNKVLTYQWSK